MTADDRHGTQQADGAAGHIVESLPDTPVPLDQLENLEESDAVRGVAPDTIVSTTSNPDRGFVATFGILLSSATVAALGWNPDTRAWELVHHERDPAAPEDAVDRAELAMREWVGDYRIYDRRVIEALDGGLA